MTDTTELALARKRNQTEGLGLFDTTHPEPVTGTSQNAAILRYLQAGYALTALEALHLFGCNRLAARIADLTAKGYAITSELVTVDGGKRVAKYTLTEGGR